MSTLYLRGKSVWIGFTDNLGSRHDKPTGFKLSNPAARWPREILDFQKQLDAQLVLGKWNLTGPTNASITFSAALAEFLLDAGSNLKRARQNDYKNAVAKLVTHFGDHSFRVLNETALFAFRNKLRAQSETLARNTIRTLNAFFNWAVEHPRRYMATNPISKRIKITIPEKPPRPFFKDELKQFWPAVRRRDPDLCNQLMCLFITGFRPVEICRLTFNDLNFEDSIINLFNDKENRYDAFPMDRAIRVFLAKQSRRFAPRIFKYRNPSTVAHYTNLIIRDIGLNPKLTPYALKKTYAKRIVQSTRNIQAAQHLMRHKSLETTFKHYSWFSVDEQREALAESRKLRKVTAIPLHSNIPRKKTQ